MNVSISAIVDPQNASQLVGMVSVQFSAADVNGSGGGATSPTGMSVAVSANVVAPGTFQCLVQNNGFSGNVSAALDFACGSTLVAPIASSAPFLQNGVYPPVGQITGSATWDKSTGVFSAIFNVLRSNEGQVKK